MASKETAYASLAELEGAVGEAEARLGAAALYRAACTHDRFETLRDCQLSNAGLSEAQQEEACRVPAEAFVREASAGTSACAETMFQAAQTQCAKEYGAFVQCSAANEGLFRACPKQLERFSACLDKQIPPQ